jgi:hypothetical protein
VGAAREPPYERFPALIGPKNAAGASSFISAHADDTSGTPGTRATTRRRQCVHLTQHVLVFDARGLLQRQVVVLHRQRARASGPRFMRHVPAASKRRTLNDILRRATVRPGVVRNPEQAALQTNHSRGIGGEEVSLSNVLPDHVGGAMPRLRHDHTF